MTKAIALTLASTLTLAQQTEDHLSPFYDEAVFVLGRLPYLLQLVLVPVTQDQAIFTFPDDALNLLEVWHDDRALEPMTHAELASFDIQWQEQHGMPLAFTEENLSKTQYRLYPVPPLPSEGLLLAHTGGAFGLDYPPGNVVLLATQYQQDLPSWLELPLILGMLAREYALESAHMDLDFARGCLRMSQALMGMLPLADIT